MPSGGMEQRQLHEFLTRLRLKWPYEFKVVDEALLVYWKPMTGIEKELMTAINVLRPGGERDASEYFTLEGHIQMWCDSAGWDFHIDMSQPDVWRFGRLVGDKIQLSNGQLRIRKYQDHATVYEYYRMPRPKERGIRQTKKTAEQNRWRTRPTIGRLDPNKE